MPFISSKIVVARRKSLTATGFDESLFPGCSPAGAQLLTKGEWFYLTWRWEHKVRVQRRLPWKREGETSSPKKKMELLMQCKLLPGLSQQAASNRGCSHRVQCLSAAKRQRDVLLQSSCYLKTTSNYMFCCIFPSLDRSTVPSASVGRTENLASHSAALYILPHY